MKKTWTILTILVWMALAWTPAWAAGPDAAPTASPTLTLTPTETATPVPTFTPQATYTPLPTFTPQATYTPLPTYTPVAQPTAAPTAAVQPRVIVGGEEGRVVLGGAYTLRSGERLGGDLVIFGGAATLESDSRVDGNVVVIGGSADIASRVGRDLVLIGGVAHLRSSAQVDGQLVRVGGELQQDEGAKIYGGEMGGVVIPPLPPVQPIVPRSPYEGWFETGVRSFFSFAWHVARAFGTTIVLGLLAWLVVTLWRDPVERVGRTITSTTGISWVIGALTALAYAVVVPAFAILSAILIIACGLGLLGFGIITLASLALAVAWLMGWIALGQLFGERLLGALGVRNATPVGSAVAGTAVLTLLWLGLDSLSGLWWLCGIGFLSILGWVLFLVLSPVGLGAVVLTRFGTQDYGVPPAPPSPAPAPIAPVEPSTPESPSALSSELPASPLDKPVNES